MAPSIAAVPQLTPPDLATLAWAVLASGLLATVHRRVGLAAAICGTMAAWTAALLLWIPPEANAQARLFVGLAFVALACGRLLERRDPAAARAAWAACWLAAAAAAACTLSDPPADAAEARAGLLPVSVALILLACFAPRTASGPLALYALAVWAIALARGCGAPARMPAHHAAIALTVAAGSLVALLADLILRWDRRRRAWERDPSRPAAAIPPPKPLYAALTAAALAAAVLAAVGPADVLSVLTAFVAAIVCFVAGHVCGWKQAGVLGLIVAAETIVFAATAFVGADAYGFTLGWVIASGWLLWIARFWEQQLLDGRPWTTAGTLIAPARALARLATLAVAAAAWFACEPGRALSLPAGLALAGLVALLARMFVRDALRAEHADSAWAGLMLAATFVLPAHTAAMHFAPAHRVPLAVWFALIAVLLAMPASLRRLPAVRCTLGAAAPAAMIAWALHAQNGGSILAAALTLAAAGLLLGRGVTPVPRDPTGAEA